MYRGDVQTWSDAARRAHQAARFNALAKRLGQDNPFYRNAWAGLPADSLDYHHLTALPFTTKQQLLDDQRQHPPFGLNLTQPPGGYSRIHQTSGTTGRPLRVLDTPQSWDWWGECWRYVLDAAGVTADDRVMLAFSFGPFIGFWAAQHGLEQLGALMVPGGGMSSPQRLATIRDLGVTVLVCTPSYALHLGREAQAQGMDPWRDLPVRITLHAGEPGASVPATRARIESLWGAQCFDHTGASEVGAHGFSCSARNGIHLNEAEFIAEIVAPETGEPAAEGSPGELVLTNLGRPGFPVVRYRTGDLVRAAPRGSCSCGRRWLMLEGGILGRIDDMVCIRGVNVFPTAFQDIFDGLTDIGEHRITAFREGELDELHVEYVAETSVDRRPAIADVIRERLGIRVSLQQRQPGDLPHFELKAQRFFDRREEEWRPESD